MNESNKMHLSGGDDLNRTDRYPPSTPLPNEDLVWTTSSNNNTNESNKTYLSGQYSLSAPTFDEYITGLNETNVTNVTDRYPSSTPLSNNKELENTPSLMIRDMAFLWLALLVFYYVCGPRRSEVTIDENVIHERLQRLHDAEVAKKRRLNPEKRKEKINEQIMTGVITKFDAAKFRLAGMKKSSSPPSVQKCLCHNSNAGEMDLEKKRTNSVSDDEIQPTCCEDYESGSRTIGVDVTKSLSEDHDENLECSICLEAFEEGEILSWSRSLKCEHVFHHECLVPWLMTHNECPYCRMKIMDDDGSKDSMEEDIEATIYSDFPAVEESNSDDSDDSDDSGEGHPINDTIYGRLKRFIQRPATYSQLDSQRNDLVPEYFLNL